MYMRNVQRNNGKIKGRAKEELENYQEGRKRKKGEIERNGKRMRINSVIHYVIGNQAKRKQKEKEELEKKTFSEKGSKKRC